MIDSFEFNKIAMAVLGVIFALFSVSLLTEVIFHAEAPEQPAFVLAEVEAGDKGEATEDSGPAFAPVTPLMASADAEEGENVFKKCASCHTLEKGGANKVGPNLYNIVGRPIASHEGFSYSDELIAFGEGKDWTYEELNGFFWKPKTYVRGTAMGFVGLKDVQDRADVIAYLRTFADTPAPLPEPEAAEEEAQPAEGIAAPANDDAQPAADTAPADTAPADGQRDSETAPAEEAPAESTNEETAPAQDGTQPVETSPAPENGTDGDNQAN